MVNYFRAMKKIFIGWILTALFSCSGGKAVFICDQIYGEATVEPYRMERSLKKALGRAGYGYEFLSVPVTAVLSEVLPEAAEVVVLSPILSKQAEACAAGRPETLFVVLEERPSTRLPNLTGIPKNGRQAYEDLGRLFGRLSMERIPDPFPAEEEGEGNPETAEESPDGSVSETGDGDGIAREWQPQDASPGASVILKPAVVFSNFSAEKEDDYMAFLNAFSVSNPQGTSAMFMLEVPSVRDSAAVSRLADELRNRRIDLIFLDAGSVSPPLIELLAREKVLLVAWQIPSDNNPLWENVDLVLEWDYGSAFDAFFPALTDAGRNDIFFDLQIEKYKKNSILYPYYAEKLNDK